jgi:hypothetical protein
MNKLCVGCEYENADVNDTTHCFHGSCNNYDSGCMDSLMIVDAYDNTLVGWLVEYPVGQYRVDVRNSKGILGIPRGYLVDDDGLPRTLDESIELIEFFEFYSVVR